MFGTPRIGELPRWQVQCGRWRVPDHSRGPRGAQRRGPASPGEAAALGGFLRTIRRDLEKAYVRNIH